MTRSTASIPTLKPESSFDPESVRGDFPILRGDGSARPLVYLDNGATTQKPQTVIDAVGRFYSAQNANIHRGVYALSQEASDAYEATRGKVRRFINAADDREIVFTAGTTASINLVAATWGRANLRRGDEVIISALEHHSNIVPWQMACAASGGVLRVIPMNDAGELDLDALAGLLSSRTKMVAVTHLSNALGTINDVGRITRMAHAAGAKVLIDGAQWIAHFPTDVRAIGCDFYCFSGHKLFGTTGTGVLFGRLAELEAMPPYQGGGDMIESVTFEKTTYAEPPARFEAGTPNIAGVIGLGAAIDYVAPLDLSAVAAYEDQLVRYATERMSAIDGIRIVGTARKKSGIISFVAEDPFIASHDMGVLLDLEHIAVRTGHHCCQPVMNRLGVNSTTRASLAMYNTRQDVDRFVDALDKIVNAQAKSAGRSRAAAGDLPSTGSNAGGVATNAGGSTAAGGPAVQAGDSSVAFPEAVGESPDAAAAALVELFEMLGDRDARSRHVLEMGEKIPSLPHAFKTEENRVRGCMSTVHLVARKRPGTPDTIDILADSDAHIVRGLIGLLQQVYSGHRAGDVLAFDVESFLRRIGLDQFISSQRRNGLAGMVSRIRLLAGSIQAGEVK